MKGFQFYNTVQRVRMAPWPIALGLIIVPALMSVFVVPAALAQGPTPSPEGHDSHHPMAVPTTGTAAPTESHGHMDGGMMTGTHMPGMLTGTPMHDMGGHDMGPIDGSDAPTAPADARGGQRLEPALVGGVKEFKLTVQKVRWTILPGVEVVAYTYNGAVPGPEFRVTEGDKVRILVTNTLGEPTVVHWHGMQIPNDQDGAADVTQPAIKPGETFTYEWTAPNTPGTFFYHTHFEGDRQQTLGLYGPLIVEAKQPRVKYDAEYTVMLGEWRVKNGQTYPAMDFDGMLPNFFTINGKSYPATDTLNVKVGQRVLIRFIGSGQFIHPMHLHGHAFKIVGTDGNPVPESAQWTKDVVTVSPGERYDVEFMARAPGKWLLHCHINHHITNDGQEVSGGGGLVMVVNVTP
jgi:FtsP/CotA-like multicopper oxidase with cupredoxin domain